MKTKKWSRIPSELEIASFDGLHCRKKYAECVRTGWTCPCCDRSVFELIRWSEITGPSWRAKYADEHGMGFTIALHEHHCHGSGRFPRTLICGDCNWADGAVKRKYKLPADWSFSPAEIRCFVKMKPHSGEATIIYEVARQIYMSVTGKQI
ncbi:MAG: hypothetical protein K2X71_15660 [Methylobacterium sp.]|uniref:hypothetical protein n=1 Tax=Methylobacterium sp. TaxID=409 RepID=UPI00258FAFCB|nr:hypothetical protein [Methylobacterium sp.]MBY0297451.1 hypothetical protein [Methylobacterium sp.]